MKKAVFVCSQILCLFFVGLFPTMLACLNVKNIGMAKKSACNVFLSLSEPKLRLYVSNLPEAKHWFTAIFAVLPSHFCAISE